jgi:hypothetical protein
LLDLRCRVGVGVGAHTGYGGVGLLCGIRVSLRLLLGYGRRVSGGRVGRVREVVGGVRLTLLGEFQGGFVVDFACEEVIWLGVGRRCRRLGQMASKVIQIDSNAIQRPNNRSIHPV